MDKEARPCKSCGTMFYHKSFNTARPRTTCGLVCRYKLAAGKKAKNLATGKTITRTEKPIDWKVVDDLLLAGCNGMEISSHFDMHHDTLYKRVQEKYGLSFTSYASEKRQKGESLLRAQQFAKALGVTVKGDNTLLIWLGKQRLNQSENPAEAYSIEDKNKLQIALDIVDYLKNKSESHQKLEQNQSEVNSDLNSADSNINKDA